MTAKAPPHANGHAPPALPALAPFAVPRSGPASAWPQQDDTGQSRTAADDPGRWRLALTLPDGDVMIRVLAAAVVLAVAAFAAIVSYSHIFELGRQHHQDGTAARLLPLSVDGLIAAASLVMVHAARKKLPVPQLARAMLATGVIMTVAANVIYGIPPSWISPVMSALIGAAISAWPAVAFIGSVEMAVRFVRDARQDGAPEDGSEDGNGNDTQPPPPPPPDPPKERQRKLSGRARAAAILKRHPGLADAEVAKRAGVSERTVQRARSDITGSRT